MNCLVEECVVTPDGSRRVRVRTDAGTGVFVLPSNAVLPKPGATYDIEFTVNVGIEPMHLRGVDRLQAAILVVGDNITLSGTVEQIDADGLVWFRVGTTLLMLEANLPEIRPGAPLTISLPISGVEAYLTGGDPRRG